MNPVDLIANAIATQEGGFTPGNIPFERHNPGDLRYAGQIGATCPHCRASDGHVPPRCAGRDYHDVAVFTSREMGIVALYRQLWLQVAKGQTLSQIIAQWAPPNENDTSAYLQNVERWTGISAETQILTLLDLTPLNKSGGTITT